MFFDLLLIFLVLCLKLFKIVQIELLMLDSNTWNYLTVCKQMSPNLFKNNLSAYKSHLYYVYV